MRLIINADDLGATESQNAAILELMAARRITSATVMANGPAFASAVRSTSHFPECSFGIHLNVSAFEPLTKNPELRALRQAGEQVPNQIRSVPFRAPLVRAVHEEWRAQISAARRAGLSISHIDSHHHVHTLPALFLALKAVQREFGIRKVRISQNVFPSKKSCLVRTKKSIWNAALRFIYATRTAGAFCDFLTFFQTANRCCVRYRTLEAMVHPGSPEPAEEMRTLCRHWRSDIDQPIELVSYFQL